MRGALRSRRSVLALAGGGLVSLVGAPPARSLVADDGSPMRSSTASGAAIKGALALAQDYTAASNDVILAEWSDYNCGFCRKAARPLAELFAADKGLGWRLAPFPILSPASEEAARVQHAVYRRDGAQAGASLHLALMTQPGRADGARALALCAQLGLAEPTESQMGAAQAEIEASRAAARRLGHRFTPTFALAGTIFVGWPGPRAIADLAAQARRCGRASCD